VTIAEYLAALDAKLQEIEVIVTSSSIERELDTNLGIGFVRGHITFLDGSKLELSEQLPVEQHRFRLHYMDAQDNLIARWDSAPHHRSLSTFPFHKHTPQSVKEHGAITLIEALDEIARVLQA